MLLSALLCINPRQRTLLFKSVSSVLISDKVSRRTISVRVASAANPWDCPGTAPSPLHGALGHFHRQWQTYMGDPPGPTTWKRPHTRHLSAKYRNACSRKSTSTYLR